ncbi:MAG: hypothetical protein ABI459_09570, partial [Deltaproteobacteria bacterium]
IVNPAHGLQMTDHFEDQLPRVMSDRYVFLLGLAVAALLYGDLKVIAFLYTGFAFLGFADAFIYARVRKPVTKHIMAGAFASIVVIIALVALLTGAQI